MQGYAEIRDPIHGYIYTSQLEKEIIDLPVFQRLRRIRQLSGAYLAYPGAQHTRFEHSVGSMYLAGLAGLSLAARNELKEEDISTLRIAALLHDIGHGPFSHLLEEVAAEKTGVTHEDMTKRIILETEINQILEKGGFEPKKLSELAIGMSKHYPPYANSIVSGGLSVDIMDYLLRDSYFAGVEYGRVDVHRIINSFDLYEDELALDRAALYAFEALMIARYEMFKAVYFHKTVRAGEIMLMKAIELADEELHLTDLSDLGRYISLGDESTLAMLTSLKTHGKPLLNRARKLALDYRDRKLLKCVYEKIVHRKDRFLQRVFGQKGVREKLASEIASMAQVSSDDVYVDVPTAPSIPFSSGREALSNIVLVSRGAAGKSYWIVKLEDLPVVGAITGYVDIIRVYTSQEKREAVEGAARRYFGDEGALGGAAWWERVSM